MGKIKHRTMPRAGSVTPPSSLYNPIHLQTGSFGACKWKGNSLNFSLHGLREANERGLKCIVKCGKLRQTEEDAVACPVCLNETEGGMEV